MERKVIYQTEAGEPTDFEFQYIDKVVLGQVPHLNVFSQDLSGRVDDNSIIVFSCDERKVNPGFLSYIRGAKNLVLIHLSNEELSHNYNYYKESKVVLRSYWDPNITALNVYTIPLGFKSGFLCEDPNFPDLKKRGISWAFIGQVKSDRAIMCRALESIKPNLIHETSGWSSSDQKSVADIRSIYENTVFVPCPFGNIHPDSFRVMECLECGCIPVVVKFKGIDYFRNVYGDHPFVVGESWDDCQQQIEKLLVNEPLLLKKREDVTVWYQQFKSDLTENVSRLLSENFDKSLSRQFDLQRKPAPSLQTRLSFAAHFTYMRRAAETRTRCTSVLRKISFRTKN